MRHKVVARARDPGRQDTERALRTGGRRSAPVDGALPGAARLCEWTRKQTADKKPPAKLSGRLNSGEDASVKPL